MAAEKPDKKEKKDKKRSDEFRVSKSKKSKKEKKEKKEKLVAAMEEKLQQQEDAVVKAPAAAADSESDMEDENNDITLTKKTIVPFAIPVADEKGMKKVYKIIRKAAKNNTLKRGVKEVVKTLRKSPIAGPANTKFPGVVVIAGDISPMDVISHIPILCEDHNVPFIFVTSRAELGAAAKTKRPTSVVMIMEKTDGKRKEKAAEKDGEDESEAYGENYKSLVKYVQKEYSKQAFWVKGETKN